MVREIMGNMVKGNIVVLLSNKAQGTGVPCGIFKIITITTDGNLLIESMSNGKRYNISRLRVYTIKEAKRLSGRLVEKRNSIPVSNKGLKLNVNTFLEEIENMLSMFSYISNTYEY